MLVTAEDGGDSIAGKSGVRVFGDMYGTGSNGLDYAGNRALRLMQAFHQPWSVDVVLLKRERPPNQKVSTEKTGK